MRGRFGIFRKLRTSRRNGPANRAAYVSFQGEAAARRGMWRDAGYRPNIFRTKVAVRPSAPAAVAIESRPLNWCR